MMDRFLREAMSEDVGRGDLYALVEPSVSTKATIIAKSSGVLAGREYLDRLADLEGFSIEWFFSDAEAFGSGDLLAKLSGESHTLLRVERVFLNILLHASSIATHTRAFVDLAGSTAMLDTRKTRPLLRVFEKYASRCGGATNHRMGLDDALMLKDTHLKTILDLKSYIKKARKVIPFTTKIEVEVESLEMAKVAFDADADIVMCDNMSLDEIRSVVDLRDANYKHILLEASGNVSLESVANYAKTGVDAISSGSMIHQAKWIDISMKIE
ncbi:MAG: carboxylating nicotinate-nucleotide diphosphorylase [Sulfuricurvum sp.]